MKELKLEGLALDGGSKLYVEKTSIAELTITGIYRDGGSKRLFDNAGEWYWQCFRLGKEWEHLQGKLFYGNINDKNPKLAVGEFVLIDNKAGVTEVRTPITQSNE